MGSRRRLRRNTVAETETCEVSGCTHAGRCVRVGAGAGGASACACAGAWGGARCSVYVGHDHACRARACAPPALCVWGPDVSKTEAGAARCVCPAGEDCSAPSPGSAPPAVGAAGDGGGGGGEWAGAAGALLALAAAVLAALYLLRRRRRGAFVHARLLADNLEINNPMYLAGEEDPEPLPHHHHQQQHQNQHQLPYSDTHQMSSRHFANPVYEELYEPTPELQEHAILLREEPSPPSAERAALL